MTCKECLHYKMCDYGKIGRICTDFSDNSEWVHLPCKAGDVVYCFEPCFDTDHRPRLKVIEKEIIRL